MDKETLKLQYEYLNELVRFTKSKFFIGVKDKEYYYNYIKERKKYLKGVEKRLSEN